MAEFDLRSADQTINKQIPNGLPGEAMRKSMENKNILKEKGSLYVGTGAVETVKILGNNYSIAQTGTITPGVDGDGKVLVADSASDCGLSYKNVKDIIGEVVRYDKPQGLKEGEKTQARTNIGAAKEFTAGTGLEFNSNNSSLHLTAATASTIGGVKIGDGLNVTPSGVLSLPVSANGDLGGIKVSVVSSLPTTLADDVFYFVTT